MMMPLFLFNDSRTYGNLVMRKRNQIHNDIIQNITLCNVFFFRDTFTYLIKFVMKFIMHFQSAGWTNYSPKLSHVESKADKFTIFSKLNHLFLKKTLLSLLVRSFMEMAGRVKKVAKILLRGVSGPHVLLLA